ncbi:tetratricopeptide repeat protein [Limosilactobacillus fermentum]|uniref:tetratricopeptide repeat protein n=1 Tax=Limosilactobacillus fermentum TaxID=1613 RepID=UPI0027FF9AC3|nr:tetratricopeptide repeat protein [Limosilactobacillus fermentum]MDQ7190555.1 tetratricopeptide repeat protein [Limosilactobacillus fermentum]
MTYSEQMLDHIEEGTMDQAQKDFAWALRKDDDDTLYSLAEELYALGLTNQAQRTYLKLLDRYPQEDELRTALAEIAIDNGDNDEALSYLSQIQPSSPAYLQSLLVQADLYQTEEQFEITEAKLNEAYRIAPDEPAVLFALAEYYYLIGKFQEAIPFYFALIKAGHLEFAKVDIAGRLGTAYAQLGKFDQALGYLNQVAPGYQTSDIRFQTGLTQLALHQLKEAIITFKELAEDDGQYASVYPALAQAYAEEHHYAQALTTLQEGLAVDQYNEHLYAQAAEMASHVGDTELMATYLKRAHELDPDNQTITLQYSNFLLHQGQDDENLALLAPLVDENDDPQVEWNLAQSYLHKEDFDGAKQAFEAAAPALSDNPTFLRQLIEFYQEMGMRPQLREAVEHYLAIDPADSELQELLEQLDEDY